MVQARTALGRAASRVFSDRTLTKKAALNAAAAAVDQGARFVVGLVVNPFLVAKLGDAAFGIWQILQRLIGHVSPATGRPGEALKWTVAHEQASTDDERKRRHVGNAVAVWVLFLPILVVVGGAVSWWSPRWLGVSAASAGTVRLTAGILLVNMILLGLAYLPQSVLHGENLGYKRLGLTTSVIVLGKGLIVTVVYLGAGIVGMAVVSTLTTVVTGVVYLRIARSRVAWFGIARPKAGEVGRFVRLSGWFLLWNLVMRMMQGSDVVLLGVAGSPSLVTTYALARFVPFGITVAAATAIFGVMPGLGRLIGAGDLDRAAGVRNETMSLIWLMTVVAGAIVLMWEESFLRLWVGQRYYPGRATTMAIMLMVLQLAVIRTDSNIIDLTLNLRGKVVLGAVSVGLSLAIGWLFLDRLGMGILGLVLGFIVGRAILSVGYPWMIGRRLGIRPSRQLRGLVRPGLATAGLFVGSSALAPLVGATTWLGLFAGIAVSGVVIAALAFFGGLSAGSRGLVWIRLRKVVAIA